MGTEAEEGSKLKPRFLVWVTPTIWLVTRLPNTEVCERKSWQVQELPGYRV